LLTGRGSNGDCIPAFSALVNIGITVIGALAGPKLGLAATQPFKLEEATVAAIQAAIRSHQLSTVGVVNAYLARIMAYNGTCVKQPQGILGPIDTIANAGQINALSTLNLRPATRKAMGFDERKARSMTDSVDADPAMPDALEVAAAQDAYLLKTGKLIGPLHGIPVLVKDCVDALGMPMTAGFQGWKNYFPPSDAPLVARTKAAGGIIIGKASLSEFTNGGGDNINSVLPGYARNPYNTAYATGGSSGGTGAAIAANFALLGIGTDTGGSVRMPSAHNALVGLRPTVGLVSRTGIQPNDSVRDTAGPMTRTVTDLALLLDAIAGADTKDSATARSQGHIPASYTAALKRTSLRGARLGVLRQVFTASATDPRVLKHFETTLSELRAAGAVIFEDCVVPEIQDLPRAPQTPARRKADMIQFLAAHPGIPYGSPQAIADSRLVHPLPQAGVEAVAAAGPPETDQATIKGLEIEAAYRAAFTRAMQAARIDAVVFPTWAQLPVVNGDRNTQLMVETPDPKGGVTGLGSSLTFVGSTLQWPAL
jgi:Asp-tRNA(Asn)/Glu-tRNA(Gln) amidotransferase A subunit family amidase